MTQTNPIKTVSLSPSPHSFPIQELMEAGVWSAIGLPTRSLLPVLWSFHQRFPDACHPSRETLARLSGLSRPSVTKAVRELEEVGLVTVARDGLKPNTYRFHWEQIEIRPKGFKPRPPSPFKSSMKEVVDHSYYDEDGNYREQKFFKRQRNQLADGCCLASRREMLFHDLLQEYGIPHAAGVLYDDLNITMANPRDPSLRDRKTSVDFVVGPHTLVEIVGAVRTQRGAANYRKKIKRKQVATEQSRDGWKLILIEPDQDFDDAFRTDFVDLVVKDWATSSYQRALAVTNTLRRVATTKMDLWIRHLQQTKAMHNGSLPLKKSHGRYPKGKERYVANLEGPPRFERYLPVQPVIVLADLLKGPVEDEYDREGEFEGRWFRHDESIEHLETELERAAMDQEFSDSDSEEYDDHAHRMEDLRGELKALQDAYDEDFRLTFGTEPASKTQSAFAH